MATTKKTKKELEAEQLKLEQERLEIERQRLIIEQQRIANEQAAARSSWLRNMII